MSSVLEPASTISNMVAPRPRIWSCLLLRWKRFGWYPWVGWQHPYSLPNFAQESLNHVQHNIWPVHDQPSFTGLSNGWQGIFSRSQARPPPLRSRQSCLAVGFDTDSIEEQQRKIFFRGKFRSLPILVCPWLSSGGKAVAERHLRHIESVSRGLATPASSIK